MASRQPMARSRSKSSLMRATAAQSPWMAARLYPCFPSWLREGHGAVQYPVGPQQHVHPG
eukprot:3137167-Pyramimonas_sp.AAC.1